MTFQWLRNGVPLSDGGPISGATTSQLSVADAQKTDAGSYAVVVANTYGSMTSQVAVLKVLDASDTPLTVASGLVAYYRFGGDVRDASGNGNHGFTMGATFATDRFGVPSQALKLTPPNYAQAQIECINTIEASSEMTISAWLYAGTAISKYNNADDGGWEINVLSDGIWFINDVPADPEPFLISTGYDHQRWTHVVLTASKSRATTRWYIDGALSTESTQPIQLKTTNPDDPILFGYSKVGPDEYSNAMIDDVRLYSRALSAAEVKLLDDYEQLARDYGFTLPLVGAGPLSQEVIAGTTFELNVQAVGAAPLSYQWHHHGLVLSDGGRILGATTKHLLITDAEAEDAGTYAVVVSNAYGSTSGAPAVVSIVLNPPEIIPQPLDRNLPSGSSVVFTVGPTGSLPQSYQWRRNGVDLSDDGRVAGTKAATLTINALASDDAGFYSVVVDSGRGTLASLPTALNVIVAPPQITDRSAVLFASVQADQLALSWNEAGKGMKLQWTSNLAQPHWQEVAGSEDVTSMTRPFANAMEFFRLVKP
jgi:hypothetical protein